MKKLKFLLLLAIGLSLSACDNDKGDSNPPDDPLEDKTLVEKPIIKQNKELYFNQHDGTQISFDTLNKYLAILNEDGSFVFDTIFMIPQGVFFSPNSLGLGYHYFELTRSNLLEPRTNLSPRIRGKGDFIINPGYPSQAPEDSLWFVSKGWTVNKWFTR